VRRIAVLSAIAALATVPAAAQAQQPAVTPPPTPAAQPVESQLKLQIDHVNGRLSTALVASKIRVRGIVGTYVPGQEVIVRMRYDGEKRYTKRKAILPGPNGSGQFQLSYSLERSGRLVVSGTHEATEQLAALSATARSVDVIPRSVRDGSRRRAVRALQRRLAALGYVVGERGRYDGRTARAVLAFRKMTGMRRTTDASVNVMRRIAHGGGAFKVRHPEHGRHIEADLTRQVLALISDGKAQRIYPTSSGKPSTPTVVGSFRVYLKTAGTNAKGMVDSAYFIRGYATHGYPSVPIYPASHGCLRVPIPDARTIFNWITIGTPVDVYYGPQP
jgi:peptidoglycan hydrolase-like protein with peptidoglycan-binding domain